MKWPVLLSFSSFFFVVVGDRPAGNMKWYYGMWFRAIGKECVGGGYTRLGIQVRREAERERNGEFI